MMSEERYRLLAEGASDIVYQTDARGIILWISPSVERVLGWRPDDLLGTLAADLVEPSDLAELADRRERVLRGDDLAVAEYRVRTAAGASHWVSGFAQPVVDGDGVVQGAMVGMRDIGAEVVARQALEARERRLQMVTEEATDVILQIDADDLVQWVSGSCVRVLGWQPEQLVGRTASSFVHRDDLAELRASRGTDGFNGAESEYRIRGGDGQYRWVSGRARQYRDETGTVAGRVAVLRDAGETVRARRALEESERRFRLLAENSSDVVLLVSEGGVVDWVSPSVRKVLGWEPETLAGRAPWDLVHPDDREAAAVSLTDALHIGPVVGPLDLRVRDADGRYRWMSSKGHGIAGDDGDARVVLSLRDVDELVQAEAAVTADRARLRATLDSLLDPHVLLDTVLGPDGRAVDFLCVDANDAACAYMAHARDELVGSRVFDLLPGLDPVGLLDLYHRTIGRGLPLVVDDFPYAHEIIGSERRYDLRATRVGDSLSFTWRDVTGRYAANAALAASEAQYRLLAENSSDVVMRVEGGVLQWVSPSLTGALGWAPSAWVGRQLVDFMHDDDVARYEAEHRAAQPRATTVTRVRLRARDGRSHWVELHANPSIDDDGRPDGAVVSWRTVDTEVADELELERRARYDELTGLLNRKEVLDRLDGLAHRKARTGAEVAVLFCDIDAFKQVNDTHGHGAGDEVLHTTATRIASAVRSTDLVARIGGDELLVVLDGVHEADEATRIAEHLRRRVAEPVTVPGAEVQVTLSVGVTLAGPGESVDAVVARADAAMYRAKAAGRDRVVVDLGRA